MGIRMVALLQKKTYLKSSHYTSFRDQSIQHFPPDFKSSKYDMVHIMIRASVKGVQRGEITPLNFQKP